MSSVGAHFTQMDQGSLSKPDSNQIALLYIERKKLFESNIFPSKISKIFPKAVLGSIGNFSYY